MQKLLLLVEWSTLQISPMKSGMKKSKKEVFFARFDLLFLDGLECDSNHWKIFPGSVTKIETETVIFLRL